MTNLESLTVISVDPTVRLSLPALHVWKWLTVENIRHLENVLNVISYITLIK